MEEQKQIFRLLDMMTQPVFCVKENTVVKANAAARQLFLEEGQDVLPLLNSGREEYDNFTEGCLFLTLNLDGRTAHANVRKWEGLTIFELEPQDDLVTQALALASRELRKPLTSALSSASALLSRQEDPQDRQTLAQLNQGLFQILRLLGNMSDAGSDSSVTKMETTEAGSYFDQLFEKACTLLSRNDLKLEYAGLRETVFCLINRDQMERAVLNLLSNAVKFTPAGGRIQASLSRRGKLLCLTLQDTGSGISQEIMSSLFQRHLRQPGIEDSRLGIGLGLQLARSAAADHGGTLLFLPAPEGGTRVTLTLAIRRNEQPTLRSPVFTLDYTGGYDHALVELSDCLSAEVYDGSF